MLHQIEIGQTGNSSRESTQKRNENVPAWKMEFLVGRRISLWREIVQTTAASVEAACSGSQRANMEELVT
jgi:hypothetical protein